MTKPAKNLQPPRRIRLALFVAALAGAAAGQKLDFNGQASGWFTFNRDTSYQVQTGLRYIPGLSLALLPYLDAELSVNAFASAQARSLDSIDTDARAKPYRLWARFSTARFEARAGLQKVNFGSATLLRPLQWFDRIDPRDPLELTDGVYGLLARYYFQNDINIWAWGLLGNSSPKGWELYGSDRWVPEPGARVQVPVPRGEVAATYHHRAAWVPPSEPYPAEVRMDEDRVGLDGKWDVLVGLWFEAALTRQRFAAPAGSELWQRAATVGLDYTFGIGSGLGLTVEHMLIGMANEPFGRGYTSDAQVSALMLSYPLGLLDGLRGIALYDWRGKGVYRYLAWQRTLDKWLFSVAAFWNPDAPARLGIAGGSAAGKGVQVTAVYNH